MKEFKENIKEKFLKANGNLPLRLSRESLDKLLGNSHHNYNENISERVNFMRLIISLAPRSVLSIDYKFLKVIWIELVENAYHFSEKDILFHWLHELADNKLISDYNMSKFFKKKMIANKQISEIGYQGFHCFKLFFLLINHNEEKLYKLVNIIFFS